MIFSGVLDLELDLDELDDELKIKGPSWIHKKNMFVNPPPTPDKTQSNRLCIKNEM